MYRKKRKNASPLQWTINEVITTFYIKETKKKNSTGISKGISNQQYFTLTGAYGEAYWLCMRTPVSGVDKGEQFCFSLLYFEVN